MKDVSNSQALNFNSKTDSIFSSVLNQGRKTQLTMRINIHSIKMNSNSSHFGNDSAFYLWCDHIYLTKGVKIKGPEKTIVPLYLLPPITLNG